MTGAFDEIKSTEEQAEKIVEDAKIRATRLKRIAREDGEKLVLTSKNEAEIEGEKIIKKQIAEAENEAKEIENATKSKIKGIQASAKDKIKEIRKDMV